MNEFAKRILSGTVYLALVIGSLYAGDPWFVLLMGMFTLLALMESMDLSMGQGSAGGSRLTALVYAGLLLYLGMSGDVDPLSYTYLWAFVLQWVSVVLIFRQLQGGKPISLLYSTFYIWLPLATLAVWAAQHPDGAFNGLMFYFCTLWIYDSLAYVVGKLIGKRPIFPRISPKKTVEGTLGGLVLTLVAMWLLDQQFFGMGQRFYLLVPMVVLFGIYGDLFESFLKRKLGVKDSGKLMPGHGGILDRIDSILLSAIPYVILLVFT